MKNNEFQQEINFLSPLHVESVVVPWNWPLQVSHFFLRTRNS